LGTCLGNIVKTWGTNWEHDGNPLGIIRGNEKKKKPPLWTLWVSMLGLGLCAQGLIDDSLLVSEWM